jgi:hypothetical protein
MFLEVQAEAAGRLEGTWVDPVRGVRAGRGTRDITCFAPKGFRQNRASGVVGAHEQHARSLEESWFWEETGHAIRDSVNVRATPVVLGLHALDEAGHLENLEVMGQ